MSVRKDSGPRELLKRKISDERLCRLAARKSEETVEVIVELELPRREVEFDSKRRHNAVPLRPTRVVASASDKAAEEAVVTAARDFLTGLIGEEPVHLKAARAFVVEVSGSQLHSIAQQEFSRNVEPNRTRR